MSEETITTTETPVVQMNGKPKLFTYRDLFTVRQCLHDAKSCCRRMKGDMVFAINKNLELLNTPIRMFDKKRQEGIDMFVSKDDKGKPVVIQPTPEEAKTGKKAAYKISEPDFKIRYCWDSRRGYWPAVVIVCKGICS